ncbi:3908_t:CDS:2, partial [Acaulospora colombiana]
TSLRDDGLSASRASRWDTDGGVGPDVIAGGVGRHASWLGRSGARRRARGGSATRRNALLVISKSIYMCCRGLTIEVLTQMSLQFKKVFALRMAVALKPYLEPIDWQVSPETEVYLLTQEGAGVEEVVEVVELGGVPPGGMHYDHRVHSVMSADPDVVAVEEGVGVKDSLTTQTILGTNRLASISSDRGIPAGARREKVSPSWNRLENTYNWSSDPDIVAVQERVGVKNSLSAQSILGTNALARITSNRVISSTAPSTIIRGSTRGPRTVAIPSRVPISISTNILVRGEVITEALLDGGETDASLVEAGDGAHAESVDSGLLGLVGKSHVWVAGSLLGKAVVHVVGLLGAAAGRVARVIRPEDNGLAVLRNCQYVDRSKNIPKELGPDTENLDKGLVQALDL